MKDAKSFFIKLTVLHIVIYGLMYFVLKDGLKNVGWVILIGGTASFMWTVVTPCVIIMKHKRNLL